MNRGVFYALVVLLGLGCLLSQVSHFSQLLDDALPHHTQDHITEHPLRLHLSSPHTVHPSRASSLQGDSHERERGVHTSVAAGTNLRTLLYPSTPRPCVECHCGPPRPVPSLASLVRRVGCTHDGC
jgi:hypothetical protein